MEALYHTVKSFLVRGEAEKANAQASQGHRSEIPTVDLDCDLRRGPLAPSREHKCTSREDVEGVPVARRMREDWTEEKRLCADYAIPSDAQGIEAPQIYRELQRERRHIRPSMPYSTAMFKPLNTLNSRPRAGFGKAATTQGGRRLQPPALPVEFSRGSNVPPSRAWNEPDRSDEQQPSAKRRKQTNGQAKPMSAGSTVDLTNDDVEMHDAFDGAVVAVNGRRISPRDPMQYGSHLTASFSKSEAAAVGRWTEPVQHKPRRKSKEDRSSLASSPRDTPNGQLELRSNSMRLNRSPSVVPARQPVDEYQEERRPKILRTIDLIDERGVPTVITSQRAGGGDNRLPSGIVFESASSPQLSTEQAANQKTVTAQQHRRTIEQHDDETKSSYFHHRESTEGNELPRLNNQFIRDDNGQAGSKRGRASQRMTQSAHRPSQSDLVPSSEDELTGATNLRKGLPSMSKQVRGFDDVASKKSTFSTPPSNLRPTMFSSSVRPHPPRGHSETRNNRASTVVGADELRIPLQSLHCRGCILIEEQDIELVWHEPAQTFYVWVKDVQRMSKTTSEPVRIGPSDVLKWTEARKEDYNVAQLHGPITTNSMGKILLVFLDGDGLSNCFQCLVSKDSLKYESITVEKMKKVFDIQASVIKADHDKCLQSALVAARESRRIAEHKLVTSGRHSQPRDQSRGANRNEQEDEILYETERQEETHALDPAVHLDEPKSSKPILRPSSRVETSRFFTGNADRTVSRQMRRSLAREPTPPSPERWTRINRPERWSQSVVYPSEGARRVTVDFHDLERLDEGEFLNDNVISFALRKVEETMPSEHKDKVHYFNTFFYTALTTKNGKKALNYDAVKRWTKNKDIFSFPYIIVPINIDLHWFLAIICNLPNLPRRATGGGAEETSRGESGGSDDEAATAHVNATAAEPEPAEAIERLSLTDDERPNTAGVASEHESTESPEQIAKAGEDQRKDRGKQIKKSRKRMPPAPKKYDTRSPTIITLDSFGSSHSTEARYLKDYINAEAEEKRGMAVGTKDVQGMTAKGIPEQTNFCDCGLYLIGYIEEFAKDPDKFVTKILRRELDEHADFAGFSASAKRDELRCELLKLHVEQDADRKSKKLAKKRATPANIAAPLPDGQHDSRHPLPVAKISETARKGSPEQKTQTEPAPPADVDSRDELDFHVPHALDKPIAGSYARRAAGSTRCNNEQTASDDEMLDSGSPHPDLLQGSRERDDHGTRTARPAQVRQAPDDVLHDLKHDTSEPNASPVEQEPVRYQPEHQGFQAFDDRSLVIEDSQDSRHVQAGKHTFFS